MRIRNRKAHLPLSSLLPIPLADLAILPKLPETDDRAPGAQHPNLWRSSGDLVPQILPPQSDSRYLVDSRTYTTGIGGDRANFYSGDEEKGFYEEEQNLVLSGSTHGDGVEIAGAAYYGLLSLGKEAGGHVTGHGVGEEYAGTYNHSVTLRCLQAAGDEGIARPSNYKGSPKRSRGADNEQASESNGLDKVGRITNPDTLSRQDSLEGKRARAENRNETANSLSPIGGSRCSRVNGRGWRCCQQTLVGYSLCEHHLGKGRLRSVARLGSRKKYARPDIQPSGATQSERPVAPPNIPKKRPRLGMVKARSLKTLLSLTNDNSVTAIPDNSKQ